MKFVHRLVMPIGSRSARVAFKKASSTWMRSAMIDGGPQSTSPASCTSLATASRVQIRGQGSV